MQSFIEFITEGYARGAGNAKGSKSLTLHTSDNPVSTGMNHSDPTLDGLRSVLLDIFWPKANGDKKKETIINQCVTTFVHAMDKKLRIDEDIIIKLAETAGMTQDEVTKILNTNLDKYYNSFKNIYGG